MVIFCIKSRSGIGDSRVVIERSRNEGGNRAWIVIPAKAGIASSLFLFPIFHFTTENTIFAV
jgi:hypothetical protein